MNIEQLKKRKRQLCGQSRETACNVSHDDLAITFKLAMRGEPATPENMLIEQMRIELPLLPPAYKPFAQAVMEMYGHIYSHEANCGTEKKESTGVLHQES